MFIRTGCIGTVLLIAAVFWGCIFPVPGRVISVPDVDAGIATIAEALAQSLPGDEIQIAAGTYEEHLVITTPCLTLRGMGTVTLQGIRTTGPLPPLKLYYAEKIRLVNLQIAGCPMTYGYFRASVEGNPEFQMEKALPIAPKLPGSHALEIVGSSVEILTCNLGAGGGNKIGTLRADQSRISAEATCFRGNNGFSSGDFQTPTYRLPEAGSSAIHLRNSCINLVSCIMQGGDGGSHSLFNYDYFYLPAMGASGGHGLILEESSRAYLIGCESAGGAGGTASGSTLLGPATGGGGGSGVQVGPHSNLLHTDCEFIGGAGGAAAKPGTDGNPIGLDSSGRVERAFSWRVQLRILLGETIPDDASSCDFNGNSILDISDLVYRAAAYSCAAEQTP